MILGDLLYQERSSAKNMQGKATAPDILRVSTSSTLSSPGHGFLQDDIDALGDVYVWGEVISENLSSRTNQSSICIRNRTDVLLPKPLESNVVLDVNHVSCGVSHASLLTKQGEIFTWGEESAGRLGHGVGIDVIHPRLIESLAVYNVEFISCGEFHTCAVTASGELYTWGDGIHNVGLLGNGSGVSHWIPNRVYGPLDGLQVAFVACGTWHTALITSSGKLFTFGDGTFGALGHGSRESFFSPREVESLTGLKTISVACGVWHTAAIVEVIVTHSNPGNLSGKLFTWGDGDKYKLGHGDKEPRLKPTCVPSLIDYNFHRLSCGHNLTIGLTISGRVLTMGSNVYGQLGTLNYDGKLPYLVQDKLASESVLEVSCGSYHVAVLTARSEVYTWGKGANGRLGHGDVEDRKTPALVEALKDRTVKHISCGSSFTAAICVHKWVLGAEQSQCAACRQPFGFTRKRHNCYNCGLVHCHSCSSRKALMAALAPNPRKPYRVCDSCNLKLTKILEFNGVGNKRNAMSRLTYDSKYKFERTEIKLSSGALPDSLDLCNNLEIKAEKEGRKSEAFTLIRAPLVPSLLQLKEIKFNGSKLEHNEDISPVSRKPSPPCSVTPVPTTSGLSFSKSMVDNLKKTNEILNQEIHKLRSQVDTLRQQCELQDIELQKSEMKADKAASLALEELAKYRSAKEVIKSLTAQLKNIAERQPLAAYENDQTRALHLPYGIEADIIKLTMMDNDGSGGGTSISSAGMRQRPMDYSLSNGFSAQNPPNDIMARFEDQAFMNSNHVVGCLNSRLESNGDALMSSSKFSNRKVTKAGGQVDVEWIGQYEPGVYITLVTLHDGTRDLKRIRFSRRRFVENQAEIWWSENCEKVRNKYNVGGPEKVLSSRG